MGSRFSAVLLLSTIASLAMAGCTGNPPLQAAVIARAPQTRAASVDGFKARIEDLATNYLAKRDLNADRTLSVQEAGMPELEFKRADRDVDQQLSLSELIEFYHRDMYGAFNQVALNSFKRLDTDGSDSLTFTEFMRLQLSANNQTPPPQPSELLFRMTDRSRNFSIDFEEFEDLLAWNEVGALGTRLTTLPAPATGTSTPPAAPSGSTPTPLRYR